MIEIESVYYFSTNLHREYKASFSPLLPIFSILDIER